MIILTYTHTQQTYTTLLRTQPRYTNTLENCQLSKLQILYNDSNKTECFILFLLVYKLTTKYTEIQL